MRVDRLLLAGLAASITLSPEPAEGILGAIAGGIGIAKTLIDLIGGVRMSGIFGGGRRSHYPSLSAPPQAHSTPHHYSYPPNPFVPPLAYHPHYQSEPSYSSLPGYSPYYGPGISSSSQHHRQFNSNSYYDTEPSVSYEGPAVYDYRKVDSPSGRGGYRPREILASSTVQSTSGYSGGSVSYAPGLPQHANRRKRSIFDVVAPVAAAAAGRTWVPPRTPRPAPPPTPASSRSKTLTPNDSSSSATSSSGTGSSWARLAMSEVKALRDSNKFHALTPKDLRDIRKFLQTVAALEEDPESRSALNWLNDEMKSRHEYLVSVESKSRANTAVPPKKRKGGKQKPVKQIEDNDDYYPGLEPLVIIEEVDPEKVNESGETISPTETGQIETEIELAPFDNSVFLDVQDAILEEK